MELKRILARDSRSANEKAIQLYGVDVLIISSQRLDNQTELIVAVDLDKSPAVPLADVADVKTPPAEKAATQSDFVPFSKLFQSASAFAPLPSDERPVVMPQAVTSVQASAPLPMADLAHAAAVTRDADAAQTRHDSQRSLEIVEMMRQEMAALRKEFSLSRQMMPWQDGLRLSPEMQKLSLAMSEAGVPAGLRALLTDSIQALDSIQEALPVMHSLLANALSRPAMAVPHTGVNALCGPSGAGKTSMVGRLALAAAMAHGAEQQAMVSFADQRPGAWAQMQLLAAQSGVACYRAANPDMLQTLLEDLEGKTFWIDTCGTDFLAQAALLMECHPKVLRHAVLPVDATVTSVQKILRNSNFAWSSLMLSKVDEAAYPWALIRGLSEQSLSVSCMAGDSRIAQEAISFDADLLVKLALAPLVPDLGAMPPASTVSPLVWVQSVESASAAKSSPEAVMSISHEEDIVTPTLMGAVPASAARITAADPSRVLKVVHG
jgi:flagellar biosynthesis GTPase FlhF